MAHIHLPEGALPLWAVLLWSLLAALVLAYSVYSLRRDGIHAKHVALGGMIAAASFTVFQVNIPVLGGVHLSMTALIGILVGPALGSIVAFVVNVLSAMLGHGAWGFLGANTLVGILEATGGYSLFYALRNRDWRHFPAATVATIGGLATGSILMGAIPLVSGIREVAITGSDLAIYMSLLVAVNLGVAVIEGFVTGSVVKYIATVRPDLIGESELAEHAEVAD